MLLFHVVIMMTGYILNWLLTLTSPTNIYWLTSTLSCTYDIRFIYHWVLIAINTIFHLPIHAVFFIAALAWNTPLSTRLYHCTTPSNYAYYIDTYYIENKMVCRIDFSHIVIFSMWQKHAVHNIWVIYYGSIIIFSLKIWSQIMLTISISKWCIFSDFWIHLIFFHYLYFIFYRFFHLNRKEQTFFVRLQNDGTWANFLLM